MVLTDKAAPVPLNQLGVEHGQRTENNNVGHSNQGRLPRHFINAQGERRNSHQGGKLFMALQEGKEDFFQGPGISVTLS